MKADVLISHVVALIGSFLTAGMLHLCKIISSLLTPEFYISVTKPIKPDSVSPTALHRCNVCAGLCCPGATVSRGDGPATCYTLRRNTASLMKI